MNSRIINAKGAEVTIATRHGQDYIFLTYFNYGEFAIIKNQSGLNSYQRQRVVRRNPYDMRKDD